MKIIIVYHSGSGHTKVVAEHIAKGAFQEVSDVQLIPAEEAHAHFKDFEQADTLVFGSTRYGKINWQPALQILLPGTGISYIHW